MSSVGDTIRERQQPQGATMIHTPEAMENSRRRLLMWGLIGFGIWQGADLTRHILRGMSRAGEVALLFIGLAGAALWVFNMIRLQSFIRAMKNDPALAQALGDERYRHAVLRSYAAAFWTLLITSGLLALWSAFLPLSGRVAAQLFLVVGVCSAQIALLIYDRD